MFILVSISLIFLILYSVLIIYYRFAFTSIPIISNSTIQQFNNSTTLSIIIPARNEAENIEQCIQSILQNNYPTHLFEIIVVDDHSEDNTANIVKEYAAQNVKLILLKDFVTDKINSYKKKAIEVAITQASGTLIITTDADCIVPATWLQTIASFYEEKKPAFIAAPVLIDASYFSQRHTHKENAQGSEFNPPSLPQQMRDGEGQVAMPILLTTSNSSETHTHKENAKGSELDHPSLPQQMRDGEGRVAMPILLTTSNSSETHTHKENAKGSEFGIPSPLRGEGQGLRSVGVRIFQSLDFMTLQGITAAVVHKKQMTMCNGANMAYERAVFYEVGGFAGIDNIASGDDMLLMHKIYKQYPNRVLFLKSKAAIVKTAPVNTISQFFNQRVRWASKADKYDDKRIMPVLVLVYFFNCFMLVIPIIGVFVNIQYSIFNVQCSMLGLWLWMLLLKIVVELFFLFPVANFFGKTSMLWFFPILQPFHICYTIIAGWLGKFGKYTWKERKVQ
jgi:cellulose synthase/poly-beta-1,6-N-acetylglucosamine synthase-like glycosyltransferase